VRILCKLAVLIAILLMPLTMSAPPAAAAGHHSMSMPMGHCPDQGSNHDTKGGIAECTMACAAALPAADFVGHSQLTIVCEPLHAGVAQRLHGLHPETATPPPKAS